MDCRRARRRTIAITGSIAVLLTSCTQTESGSPAPVTVTPSSSVATTATTSGAPSTTSDSSSASSAPAPVTSAAHAPPTWASTFARVSTGVVRVDNSCGPGGPATGTGFLVAPDLVATVAHVVETDGALRVTSPTSGLVEPGEVVGYDHDDDIALVRTATALPGHVFQLARTEPDIGAEIAAIGFPLAKSMQLTIGHINGNHDHRYVGDEFDLSDVLLSDVAMNPGNSGGPWLTLDGTVVALAESGPPYDEQDQANAQGNNGGVPAADALTHIRSWENNPEPQADRGCQPASARVAAEQTLSLYFYAINQSDYATAYAQLDSGNHPISGLAGFIQGVQSSTDYAPGGDGFYAVQGFGREGGNVYLDVEFVSQQRSAQGQSHQTCTDWTLRYVFVNYRGVQLIRSTPATPGTPGHTSC